jgi:hypothetical protein
MQDVLEQLSRFWKRAAKKECIEYGEHGFMTETVDGKEVCFNCGSPL